MIKPFYTLFKKSGVGLRNWSCIGMCLVFVLPMRSLAQNPTPSPNQLRQTWYSKDKKVTYTQRMDAGLNLLRWQYAISTQQDSLLIIAQEMLAEGKQHKDPKWTAESLYWIARYHYNQGDIQGSIRAIHEALLQPELKDCADTYWYYNELGSDYVVLDQLDSAAYYYKKALASGKKHGAKTKDLDFVLYNLAGTYTFQGKYLDAMDLHTEVINTAGLDFQFLAHISLGRIFKTLGLHSEAIANYGQADVIAKKFNDNEVRLSNYGAQLNVSTNLAEARQLIQKGLALRDSFHSNHSTLNLFLSAGALYLDSLKLDHATDFYQQALAVSIKIKQLLRKNEALLALAKIHQLQGRTQQSMQICQNIKAALEKNHAPRQLATLYEILSKNYEALQQPAQALFYLRQKEAQEALLNDEENIKVALNSYIQRKSEQERTALNLAKNNAEKLSVAVQAKARLNYGIFGLLSLFLAGVVAVYYTFYHQKKSAAEQLTQVNQLLEGEKEKLTLSNKKLQRFSGVVSHDILSNLDLILSTGNVLVGARPNPTSLNTYYTLTQNTGRQLKEYCLGLLAEAKATQGVALTEIGDPNTVLTRVMERFGPALQEKGFTVDVGELPSSSLPLSVVEQVLQNLLSNALRYASDTPNPHLHIGSGIDEQGNLCWYVADNGPGQAAALNRVIQGEHSGSAKGQGVGLSLLQASLRDYGWRLQAEAVDGGGVRMVVGSRG
jgi:signal transduction histidine kinase